VCKIVVIVILFFGCFFNAYAQDIIFFKDGTQLKTKIIEIRTSVIVYKRYKQADETIYTVSKDKVMMIEYNNGAIEIINEDTESRAFTTNRRKMFTINLLGAYTGSIHLAYEKLNRRGTFGVKTNITASVAPDLFLGIYAIGSDFNFYRGGQKKFNYFFGPSFRTGVVRSEGFFAAVLINNGFAYSAKKGFYTSLQFAVGPSYYQFEEFAPVYGFIMFNIGKKF
jgi:hypothetical protein